MKYLSIIRHAQANHARLSQRDYDRTLTARGLADAEQTARHLMDLTPMVDQILCSAAQRTRQTAMVLCEQSSKHLETEWPSPVRLEEAYLANAITLRTLIQNALLGAEHVVLIGHNPGVEELVAKLCKPETDRINHFMATGTLAHLRFDLSDWKELGWGRGELIKFVHISGR